MPQDAAVQTQATGQEVTPAPSAPRWLDQLSGAQVAVAIAAAIVGMLGVTALTTFWAWLAMSGDPMWWVFTAIGFALSLGLALTVTALNQRAQKLTWAAVPPSD